MTSTAPLRKSVYTLLITVAAAMACGRILATVRVYEPDLHKPESAPASDYRPAWPTTRPAAMPTFSSNDRSRWATVRALVDDGTYVVGRRSLTVVLGSLVAVLGATDPVSACVFLDAGHQARISKAANTGIVFEPGWETVDKVLDPSTMEFFSSKPPLLSTLVAGEYWLLKKLFGWSLVDNPFSVVRFILITINGLPLILYLALLSRVAEAYGKTDWGRLYIVTAGAFGTLVTPFIITFNNHSVAVVSTMITLVAALHIWTRASASSLWYVLAGFAAGFTACNELPALALAAGLFLVLLTRSPRATLLFYAPAAALPLLAQLGTNYLALGQLDFAYSKFGGPWYEYEGSHWRVIPGVVRHGIDWAGNSETRAQYAFHLILGHHGLLSLTPFFLLGFLGMIQGSLRTKGPTMVKDEAGKPAFNLPWLLFPAALALSLLVIGFYLFNKTVNYGGWSTGPRWLLWLTPLWLVTMLPVLDRWQRSRWGRGVAITLLALSVLSASYPAWNPWRHPWIYRFMDANGLIPY